MPSGEADQVVSRGGARGWRVAAGLPRGARYLIYMARPERFELPTLRFEA
jgi:hypothetical protein